MATDKSDIQAADLPPEGGTRVSWDVFYQVGELKEHAQVVVSGPGGDRVVAEWIERRGEVLEKLNDEGAEADRSFGGNRSFGGGSAPAAAAPAAVASNGTNCVECSEPIKGFTGSDGKTITAEQMVRSRIKNYGAAYCNQCYKKHPKVA